MSHQIIQGYGQEKLEPLRKKIIEAVISKFPHWAQVPSSECGPSSQNLSVPVSAEAHVHLDPFAPKGW